MIYWVILQCKYINWYEIHDIFCNIRFTQRLSSCKPIVMICLNMCHCFLSDQTGQFNIGRCRGGLFNKSVPHTYHRRASDTANNSMIIHYFSSSVAPLNWIYWWREFFPFPQVSSSKPLPLPRVLLSNFSWLYRCFQNKQKYFPLYQKCTKHA